MPLQDFSKEPMTAIPIQNPELLQSLNSWLWFVELARQGKIPARAVPVNKLDREPSFDPDSTMLATPTPEQYLSKEYLHKIMDMKENHDGYPEEATGFGLDYLQNGGDNRITSFLEKHVDSNFSSEYKRRFDQYVADICGMLGVRHNALAQIYAPGGFISWHNNANAAAYNVLFTWSETGDGYWEHVDPRTDEIIHIPDNKGWNCKVGYYGSYNEWPSRLVYHSAYTDCWRMTIAFTLTTKEASVPMWNMLVEDIMTP